MRIAVAILVCALPSLALAQQEGERLEVWQSSYGDESLIALEAETLLTTLDTNGVLAYEPVFDASGKTVQTLMREGGRFVGAFYPRAVDQMVCRANPTRCTIGDDGVTRWTNKQGDTLNLPAVTFQPIITFGTADKPVGMTVNEVWSVTDDCAVFGVACVDAVRALNQNNPVAYDRDTAGQVTVPQLAYQAEITEKTVVPQAIENWGKGDFIKVDNFLAKVTAFDSFSTFDGEPDVPDDDRLLSLIGFPWPSGDPDTVDPAYERKVRIGFVDGWVDDAHSEFGGRIKVERDAGTQDLAAFCGAPSSPPSKLCDHATHVVGIVAAAIDGRGIAGLNPFAEITVRISDTRNVQDASIGRKLAGELFADATGGQVDLFNLSWGYPQPATKDPLGEMIVDTLKDRLFVVAVGNTAQHFNLGSCGVLPACFTDAPNVVSVVGLDRSADYPRRGRTTRRGRTGTSISTSGRSRTTSSVPSAATGSAGSPARPRPLRRSLQPPPTSSRPIANTMAPAPRCHRSRSRTA